MGYQARLRPRRHALALQAAVAPEPTCFALSAACLLREALEWKALLGEQPLAVISLQSHQTTGIHLSVESLAPRRAIVHWRPYSSGLTAVRPMLAMAQL
jgi:hypothetical protein